MRLGLVLFLSGCVSWSQVRYDGPEAPAPALRQVLFPFVPPRYHGLAQDVGQARPWTERRREGLLFVDNPTWTAGQLVIQCRRGLGQFSVCVSPRSSLPVPLAFTEADATDPPCSIVMWREVKQCE